MYLNYALSNELGMRLYSSIEPGVRLYYLSSQLVTNMLCSVPKSMSEIEVATQAV